MFDIPRLDEALFMVFLLYMYLGYNVLSDRDVDKDLTLIQALLEMAKWPITIFKKDGD